MFEKSLFWSLLTIVTLAAVGLAVLPVNAADVTSTWDGTTGNWTDFTRWSSNPLYPNNGNGGFTYDTIINSGTVTQDLAAGITIPALSEKTTSLASQGHEALGQSDDFSRQLPDSGDRE